MTDNLSWYQATIWDPTSVFLLLLWPSQREHYHQTTEAEVTV
jgi:hypothetical protein